jgi:hypothetical protein
MQRTRGWFGYIAVPSTFYQAHQQKKEDAHLDNLDLNCNLLCTRSYRKEHKITICS